METCSARKKRRVDTQLSVQAAVMQLVVTSEFLATVDLGRLLLRTSKSLVASFFPIREELWKCLCASKWQDFADQMLESSGLSPEDCFLKFIALEKPPPGRPPFQVRPCKFSPQDYLLYLTVRESGKIRFYKVIRGQDASEFFQSGRIQLKFDEPVLVPAWKNKLNLIINDTWDHEEEVTLDLMRLPDQQCLRVLWEFGERLFAWNDSDSDGEESDDGIELRKISTDFTRATRSIHTSMLTSYGKSLALNVFGGAIEFSTFSGFDYQQDSNGILSVSGLVLTTWAINSEHERLPLDENTRIEDNQVTFAHLLEAYDHARLLGSTDTTDTSL